MEEPSSEIRRSGGFVLFLLLCVDGAIRLAWLAILPRAAVSLDLSSSWRAIGMALERHLNPYVVTHFDNYPPAWTAILYGLTLVSTRYGFDFLLLIRLVLIVGDMALLASLYFLLRTLEPGKSHARLPVVGYCLNPLLILLTVQHGNFDSLCMVWVVLFLRFLLRFADSSKGIDWLCAAGCLGLAIFVKQFALALWPLMAAGAWRLDRRYWVMSALLVVGPTGLSLAPLYAMTPEAITRNVLEYRSIGNAFGLVGLLGLAGLWRFWAVWAKVFMWVVLSGMAVLAVVVYRRGCKSRGDAILCSAMIFLGLFTVGPGYGSQYWFWVVPLIVVCYASADGAFRRMIWVCMGIVIATNVFEYAVEANLGRFAYYLFPSPSLQSIGDYFPYPSWHLVWLRMPMSLAAFALLVAGIWKLVGRGRKFP